MRLWISVKVVGMKFIYKCILCVRVSVCLSVCLSVHVDYPMLAKQTQTQTHIVWIFSIRLQKDTDGLTFTYFHLELVLFSYILILFQFNVPSIKKVMATTGCVVTGKRPTVRCSDAKYIQSHEKTIII